jgi:small subunit ribosomal protein S3
LGHKVHPTGFRLGVIKGWDSRWYANRNYKDLLAEDQRLRALIGKRLANAGISRIEIERVAGTQLGVTIHTAKPGIVIGKSGESVERLRQLLETETKKKVRLTILEIRNPEVEATLVARSIAEQLEKRISFRRAMKQAVQKAMRANAKGIKIVCGGRLGGAEIARVEKEVEGSVPLQTLRANIDFGLAEAHTTYGVVGIKVWVYHGDVLPERQRQLGLAAAEPVAAPVTAGGRGGERGDRGGRGGDRGPRPGGDRGPRPGGDRGPRPGGDRGPRPGGDRGPRPGGMGAPGAAPGRSAPGGGPSADRGPRSSGSGSGAPGGQRPAGGAPPVRSEASPPPVTAVDQALGETPSDVSGTTAQAMTPAQPAPAPAVPEDTAPKGAAPDATMTRPEEEPGS